MSVWTSEDGRSKWSYEYHMNSHDITVGLQSFVVRGRHLSLRVWGNVRQDGPEKSLSKNNYSYTYYIIDIDSS